MKRPALLVISQVYVPDPAAVGQYMADAAEEMARRGYRVVVYTSARGYDDPSRRYPVRETLNGVQVRRLPLSSFGKSSIAVRLAAQAVFLAQAFLRGLFTRGLRGILVSTSPPFCGVAGAALSRLRHVPVKYWVMDLNPDLMIATGRIAETSLAARVFDALNRAILRQASDVVVLDRFMAERVRSKLSAPRRVETIHLWSHESRLEDIPDDENPFLKEHSLEGKFVLMYSGNHSPVNPIGTILDAVELLQDSRLFFLSIGGGEGKKEIESRMRRGVRNIGSLPYEPFERIRYSCSAADVHLVSVGDDVVGIVHPSKVYGAMAVARPVLFLGPESSPVGEIVKELGIGWHVRHGDVPGAVRALEAMMSAPPDELRAMGQRAAAAIRDSFSRGLLLRRFCDVLQRGLPDP